MKLQLVALLALALIFFGCAGGGAIRQPASYGNISEGQLGQMMKSKDFFLLDVHVPEAGKHLDGTDAFIPYDSIEENAGKLPANKNAKIVVYCRSGRMSEIAAKKLAEMGYSNVFNVQGGIAAYREGEGNSGAGQNGSGENAGAVGAGNAAKNESATQTKNASDGNESYREYYRLAEKVIPEKGISLGVKWGDLGPRTVRSGALNVTKFEWLMKRNRIPLTQEQIGILVNGSNGSIIIDANNSNFILDVFWAFGLVNENPVLEAGPAGRNMGTMPMMASTGGWPLGDRAGGELYSSEPLAPLSRKQQEIVWWVADYTYRPCCDNPTAYPDCNHGMAALGIAEWMAYQNASREEIYDALLAANSYWFPQVYIEMAAHLERQNKSWENASAKELLSKEYSSASGYSRLKGSVRDFPEIKIPGGCGA